MHRIRQILFLSLLFTALAVEAQDTIRLRNTSFEGDKPAKGKMPVAWKNYNQNKKSVPCIQPGRLKVTTPTDYGRQYLSMVTRKGRDNDCDEIGQKLPDGGLLMVGNAYEITVYLAYSPSMLVPRPGSDNTDVFGQPAILRILGYNPASGHKELLAESPLINHKDWQPYTLRFVPQEEDYDEILFQAYYNPQHAWTYNGNILIDRISAITRTKDIPAVKEQPELSTPPKTEIPAIGKPGAAIALVNPSFEDSPKCCEAPEGWYNCGLKLESPPDIQPGSFQVTKTAADGKTYLGLVVRDNETWEAVGQRLSSPLLKGKTYMLQVQLAQSPQYISLSRMTLEEVNYNSPAILRIWAGTRYCEKSELMAMTDPISNTNWHNYQFHFTPKNNDYDFITIEANYRNSGQEPYNGNILVDELYLNLLEN